MHLLDLEPQEGQMKHAEVASMSRFMHEERAQVPQIPCLRFSSEESTCPFMSVARALSQLSKRIVEVIIVLGARRATDGGMDHRTMFEMGLARRLNDRSDGVCYSVVRYEALVGKPSRARDRCLRWIMPSGPWP